MRTNSAFSLSQPMERCLPNTLTSEVDGQVYPINADFHTVLACLRRLADPDRDELQKRLFLGDRFFLGRPPCDGVDLFSVFVTDGEAGLTDEPPLMDFEQDADVLYASFRQQYGIDLLHTPLHWFEFRALVTGLTGQTPLGERVRLRALDESRLAPEDRTLVRRLKAQIAVRPRVGKAEQALLAELDSRLAAGENPDDVLARLRQLPDTAG